MSKVTSRFIVGLVLFVVLADVGASAKRLTRLYLHLGDRRLSIGEYKVSGTPFDEEVGYTMRSDEAAEIWVQDWNPLVWAYATAVKSEKTQDYEAALAFGQAISELLLRFPGSKGSDSPVTVVEGLDLTAFRDDLIEVERAIDSLGGLINDSFDPTKHDDLKKDSKASVVKADAVDAGYAKAIRIFSKCLKGERLSAQNGVTVSCDDPYDVTSIVNLQSAAATNALVIANHADAVAKYAPQTALIALAESKNKGAQEALTAAEDKLKKAKTAAKAAAEKARDAAKTQADTAKAEREAAANAYAPIKQALDDLTELEKKATIAFDKARLEASQARVNAVATGQTIRLFLTGVLAMESHVSESGKTLRAFAEDAADVGPHKVDSRPYAQEKQTLTLTVTAQKKYQAFMKKPAKDRQAAGLGKVAIVVEAYRPVYVRPGVAFVLGLLKNPTYSTAKSGDQFKIVESNTSLTRYNIAAMLNIIPRRWSEPTFGGFFQIGISPKSDETGFYFGTGIQVEKIFTFGGGLMLQQVRRLGGGLTPESLLAKPEDLKVDHPFKRAFYLHATVALPGGK